MAGSHFGEHLTLDGYDGDPARLNDRTTVQDVLMRLCEGLGMTPLMEPQIVSAPDNFAKDPGGWSGFIVIAESHISVHTFPRRRFISADVYTCRNGMDTKIVIGTFKQAFRIKEVEFKFIKRGLRYPDHNLHEFP